MDAENFDPLMCGDEMVGAALPGRRRTAGEGKEESQGVTSLLITFITIGMHLSGQRSRLATEVVVHGAFSDSAPQHYCILANFGFVHDHGH